MARCSHPSNPLNRLVWSALAATTTLLVNGTTSARAGPATPSTAPPDCPGWSGLPMGQRSADTHFIVMMIHHHEGAIAMADLVLRRSRRPEIRALATRIRDSPSQENAQMRRWYRQWTGSEVPAWPAGGRGHGLPCPMGHHPWRVARPGGSDGARAERGDRADGAVVSPLVGRRGSLTLQGRRRRPPPGPPPAETGCPTRRSPQVPIRSSLSKIREVGAPSSGVCAEVSRHLSAAAPSPPPPRKGAPPPAPRRCRDRAVPAPL